MGKTQTQGISERSSERTWFPLQSSLPSSKLLRTHLELKRHLWSQFSSGIWFDCEFFSPKISGAVQELYLSRNPTSSPIGLRSMRKPSKFLAPKWRNSSTSCISSRRPSSVSPPRSSGCHMRRNGKTSSLRPTYSPSENLSICSQVWPLGTLE